MAATDKDAVPTSSAVDGSASGLSSAAGEKRRKKHFKKHNKETSDSAPKDEGAIEASALAGTKTKSLDKKAAVSSAKTSSQLSTGAGEKRRKKHPKSSKALSDDAGKDVPPETEPDQLPGQSDEAKPTPDPGAEVAALQPPSQPAAVLLPAQANPRPADQRADNVEIEERDPGSTLLPVVGGVVVVVGLLLAIVMVLLLLGAAQDDASLVSTTSGKFVGTMVPVNGGKVYRWLGIPYAKSTGGKNRFHKPIPRTVQKRATADKPRPPCPQWVNGTLVGSEDCLHMNVWAPNGSWATRSNRTLVLASSGYWFQRGSNNEPDWAELAFQGGMVVMSPNVRLGVLGFMHPKQGLPEHDVANEDAIAAVNWAIANAAAFGANSDEVALVGHGSGAYMLARAAARLNISSSRAILEGLLPRSVFPVNRGTPEPSKNLSASLGCGDHLEDSALLSCFMDAGLEALLSTAAEMELRFAPGWCDDSLSKREPLPAVKEVIAGTDIGQVISFLQVYVMPRAVVAGEAGNISDLSDFVLRYIFANGTAAYHRFKDDVPATEKGLQYAVALFTSGCSTRELVKRATASGYHYITSGTGRDLFEPVLDMAAVVNFLKNGSVPKMKNGQPWQPWKLANTTRLEIEESTEVLTEYYELLNKLCAKFFW